MHKKKLWKKKMDDFFLLEKYTRMEVLGEGSYGKVISASTINKKVAEKPVKNVKTTKQVKKEDLTKKDVAMEAPVVSKPANKANLAALDEAKEKVLKLLELSNEPINSTHILQEEPEEKDGQLSEIPFEIAGDVPVVHWDPETPFGDEVCLKKKNIFKFRLIFTCEKKIFFWKGGEERNSGASQEHCSNHLASNAEMASFLFEQIKDAADVEEREEADSLLYQL